MDLKKWRFKFGFIFFLCCFLLWNGFSFTAYGELKKPTILINNKSIHTEPIILNNHVYIPLRAAMESLGADVQYHQGNVMIKKSDVQVSFQPGAHTIEVNGHSLTLDQLPILRHNTTYVPLRFFGNIFGYQVTYDIDTQEIRLSENKNLGTLAGFIENEDGSVVSDGTVNIVGITTVSAASINQGFFRVQLKPGTYHIDNLQFGIEAIDTGNAHTFSLKKGQHIFVTMKRPENNLSIHVKYPDGSTVQSGNILLQTQHAASTLIIDSGVASAYIPANSPFLFQQISIPGTIKKDWDVHAQGVFTDAGKHDLTITLHHPNIHISIQGKNSMEAAIVNVRWKEINNQNSMGKWYSNFAENGSIDMYVPDGKYEWAAVGYNVNAQGTSSFFPENRTVYVKNGKPDQKLSVTLPPIISGTIRNNDGTVTEGEMNFILEVGNAFYVNRVPIKDGKYSIPLIDGTYQVSYQPNDHSIERELNNHFVVKDGKPQSSMDYIINIF